MFATTPIQYSTIWHSLSLTWSTKSRRPAAVFLSEVGSPAFSAPLKSPLPAEPDLRRSPGPCSPLSPLPAVSRQMADCRASDLSSTSASSAGVPSWASKSTPHYNCIVFHSRDSRDQVLARYAQCARYARVCMVVYSA